MNTDMTRERLFTICCPDCGGVLAKSYAGSRTIVRCRKCSAEFYYEVHDGGLSIDVSDRKKAVSQ